MTSLQAPSIPACSDLALQCILKDVCLEARRWQKGENLGASGNANFKESTGSSLASKDASTGTAAQRQSGVWVNAVSGTSSCKFEPI